MLIAEHNFFSVVIDEEVYEALLARCWNSEAAISHKRVSFVVDAKVDLSS